MNDITCGEARRLEWGGRDEVVLPVERARAQAHLARCAGCRRFTAEMELLRRAAGELRDTTELPTGLRDRVRAAIAMGSRRRFSYRRWGLTSLGLAAAVALIVLGGRLALPDRADPIRHIVSREREFLALAGIESSDPGTVQAWLASLVAFTVHVPTFPDARLSGAAVSQVNGHPAAVMRFQVGDRPVTYVVVLDTQASADSAFHEARFGDLSVVSWSMTGLVHVWLGTIPATHLTSLAHRCVEQARAAARLSAAPRSAPYPS